ncbi:class I SAM-dependent methyltransferase [Mycolicibacterium sp. A43C]
MQRAPLPLSTVGDASVDWATAGLSLNNVADLPATLAALSRVLKPAGRLVFTVPHPCFDAPRSTAVTVDGALRRIVGDYMDQGFWRTTAPQSVRRVGNHHRTIGTYANALVDNGFQITSLTEPAPDELVRQGNPHRVGLPPFLLICAIHLEPERVSPELTGSAGRLVSAAQQGLWRAMGRSICSRRMSACPA